MLSPPARHASAANPMNQLPESLSASRLELIAQYLRKGRNIGVCLGVSANSWTGVTFDTRAFVSSTPAACPVGCTTHKVVWKFSGTLTKKVLISRCFKLVWVKKGQIVFLKLERKASGGNQDSFIEVACFKNTIRVTEPRWKCNQSPLQHMQTFRPTAKCNRKTNNRLFLNLNLCSKDHCAWEFLALNVARQSPWNIGKTVWLWETHFLGL